MSVIGLFCSVAIFEIEHDAQPDKFRNIFDATYFTMVNVATVGYGDLSPITTLGRVTVMLSFITGLAVFAGILDVMGASFFKVMEEEIDPNVAPLVEFQKERERQLVRWPEKKRVPGGAKSMSCPSCQSNVQTLNYDRRLWTAGESGVVRWTGRVSSQRCVCVRLMSFSDADR